jgi:hypothetical protein
VTICEDDAVGRAIVIVFVLAFEFFETNSIFANVVDAAFDIAITSL